MTTTEGRAARWSYAAALRRLTLPNGWPDWYVLCRDCDHFVDENDAHVQGQDDYAPFIHLDDGKEHDHDAWPGYEGNALAVWRDKRPDLFFGHPDGKIGPNSRYHRRRTA